MAYQWRRLPDAPFAPRDGAMALVTSFGGGGDPVPHVFGGWSQSEPENFTNDRTNEIWRADDIEDGEWTRIRRSSQWSPRHTFGIVQDASGNAHVFGSDVQEGRYLNDHWVSVGTGAFWKLAQDDIPWGNRILGIPAFFGGKVLMMGGQSLPALMGPVSPLVYHADIWGFDPAVPEAGWVRLVENCPALPRGTVDHAVVHNGELYLYGGGEYGGNDHDREVWRTVGGDITNWTRVTASAPWQGRLYSNALSWDGKLWLLFGFGGPAGGVQANLSDCWYSADNGATWTQVAGEAPPARHAATAFVWNDSIVALCGSSVAADGNPVNDVWQLRDAG